MDSGRKGKEVTQPRFDRSGLNGVETTAWFEEKESALRVPDIHTLKVFIKVFELRRQANRDVDVFCFISRV